MVETWNVNIKFQSKLFIVAFFVVYVKSLRNPSFKNRS
jgi:hypothetical protein